MANKLAFQNGNWNDGSTWNDGVVPTVDDDVDLVSYVVAIPVNTTIYAKTITNTGGGYINNAGACIVNSDLYPNTGYLFYSAGITVNGNVTFSDTGYFDRFASNGQGGQYTINGNVTVESTCSRNGVLGMPYYSGNDTINGNIVCYANTTVFRGATGVGTLTINGNVDIEEGYFFTTSVFGGQIIFNGDVTLKTMFPNSTSISTNLVNNTVSFYGNLTYNYAGIPIIAANYVFGESSIVRNNSTTGLLCANTQQFDYANPQPDEVSAGVVYGVNRELVGELELPQPATVLEGVEYGEYVGTLAPVQGTIVESGTIVNLTEDQVRRIAESITAEMAQTMLQQYFG